MSDEQSLKRIDMVEVENSTDLEFKIQTNRVRYSKDEPLLLQMSITNLGNTPIIINKRFIINSPEEPKEAGTGEIYLIITSSTGDTLSFNAFLEVGYPTIKDYVELKPGEMVSNDNKQDISKYYEFSRNVEYRITAYYYNYFSEGIEPKPWQGKIRSNTLAILIQ